MAYYEGPGGDVMVLPLDGSFDIYSAQRMREADTLLLGHKTYDAFKGFWPSMADNDAASPAQKEISRRQNEMDKVVISDTLTEDETDPWRDTIRQPDRSGRSAASPAELVATTHRCHQARRH